MITFIIKSRYDLRSTVVKISIDFSFHFGIHAGIISIAATSARCIGSIFSGFFVLKFGPRPILLVSTFSGAIFAISAAVLSSLKNYFFPDNHFLSSVILVR